MTTSYKVNDKLFLIRQEISKKAAAAKPVEVPTNHVFIYDCSGSMYNELPKIREQLKKSLKSLLKEKDTFSAIWFSGRGECDVLLEAEPVATLTDLKAVEAQLDRWLRPCGLTGFKEPLEKAVALIDRVSKTNKNPFALCFMTDGCDNQYSQAEILKAVDALGPKVSSAAFVEYGYYANRPLLTAMAEKCGGSLIFSENFASYAPNFETIIQRRPLGGKRIEAKIEGDPIGGFAYALVDGDLVTYACTNGTVSVPEGLSEVWYVAPQSPSGVGSVGYADIKAPAIDASYAAISLFATRMNSDVVFAFLKATGDVTYIESYANCFGKQKYSEFTDASKAATFDSSKRLTKGYDPNKVPKEDAFTVIDALQTLMGDENARVLLGHPDFKYNRIGRGRIDADTLLTPEEQTEVDRLTDELKTIKDVKKIKTILEQIESITAAKKDALQFVEEDASEGFPLDGFVFNEDRPNVSFRVKRPGTVDLKARLPEEFRGNKIGKIPEKFSTFVYRNYTVIKDGLVNVDSLPVKVSAEIYEKFLSEKVVPESSKGPDGLYTVTLNLRALPVINRKMVKATSAKDFFTKKIELLKVKAAQKVYNASSDELLEEKKSEGYAALYGDPAATWLKEQGITEYSGFAPPKTVTAPATDKYLAKELKTSIKGLSGLPKVSEVRTKLAAKGKLNAGGTLMVEAINDVAGFINSDFYMKAGDKDAVLKAWLLDRKKTTTAKARTLMFETSQVMFSLVVGQTWFKEFASLDESSMSIAQDGQTYECKAELNEYEEAI